MNRTREMVIRKDVRIPIGDRPYLSEGNPACDRYTHRAEQVLLVCMLMHIKSKLFT
ncbi:hypothetical protein MHI48_11835 [Paenibacillus sp. FSL H7-0942]|uniref:hypothetical protein n=1 Tax=unclassified Paenibacillus TaxID=185978 RepID=UPI0013FD2348|nr:hypothetical protein [Paenibacillus sp. GM1FR]